MDDLTQSPYPGNSLIQSVFEQLMENIRKQDELVLSWTKYYLSIQAALAVALSFLIKLRSEDGILVNTGSLFIPFLGVVTSICLTNIILREKKWQGRYVMQIRRLPQVPETYRKEWGLDDPDSGHRGYIGQQFCWLRNVLVAGWVAWSLVALYRAICGVG